MSNRGVPPRPIPADRPRPGAARSHPKGCTCQACLWPTLQAVGEPRQCANALLVTDGMEVSILLRDKGGQRSVITCSACGKPVQFTATTLPGVNDARLEIAPCAHCIEEAGR